MSIRAPKGFIAMIVDDEPFVREDLKFFLSGYPQVTVGWETGTLAEARGILMENEPDILFLDLFLRGGSGFELMPWVDRERTALVFVTAHEQLLRQQGACPNGQLLLKPVGRKALARVLGRVLKERRAKTGISHSEHHQRC